jgi:hypothetical protein
MNSPELIQCPNASVFFTFFQGAIETGDVLDDLFDRALRNIVKGTVSSDLVWHSMPAYQCVV